MSDKEDTSDLKILGVSEAMLEALRKVFPDRCPDPSTPDRMVWIAVGAAQVVRFLQMQRELEIELSLRGPQ